MAYNYNPYLYNYNNAYYQPQPVQTPQNAQQATNDIVWVQGEAGAKAYLVAPNTTVTLWDSESPTIYLKTSDGRGIPSMRILDFKERTQNVQSGPVFKDTTSDELKDLRAKYDSLEERLTELENRPAPKRKKEEAES